MAFEHGISIIEQPTSILSPVEVSAAIPVVFGTAPVNRANREAAVNKAVLAYTFAEAVNALGYSDDWESYTLCEYMDAHFRLYGLSPAVFVNVLDPGEHSTAVPSSLKMITGGVVELEAGVVLSTVVVKDSTAATTYVKDTDYTLAFNNAGEAIITRKSSGTIPSGATQLSVAYSKLDPTAVEAADIIGGIDGTTGMPEGLELIDDVFPRFGLVPGIILAPGYSTDPTVAAVMVAKATNINGHFKALALTDIPTGEADQYSEVPAWKSSNGFSSSFQVATWPKVTLGGKTYFLSSHLAGLIGITDAANDGIPYASPSNKSMRAAGAALASGAEIVLGPTQATYLNSQGIVTAFNLAGTFKSWGNSTASFPGTTDPKDSFIPIRRMFNWVANTIILTYWKNVDDPLNLRLIETVTDSLNIWLNGLQGGGYIIGGRVEFLKTDNPPTDLLAGKMKFRVFLTPPGPGQAITFVLEYDPQYLSALTA